MRLLEKSFVKSCDGCLPTLFTQIKNECAVYMYKREYVETAKLLGYEVFISKFIKAGAALPGGTFELEDRWQYPGANAFGKTAKFCVTLKQANIEFNKLLHKLDTIVEEEVKIIYPANNKPFTLKELMVLNPTMLYPTLYTTVKKEIAAGKIKINGTQRNPGQRGKDTVIYQVIG